MTREEAIAVLNMVEAHGSLVIEAKDMAIKAMEQEQRKGMRMASEEEIKLLANAQHNIVITALEQEQKYCDRNICISNEYNGIGCDECEVTKNQEKIKEPCEDTINREDLDECKELMTDINGDTVYAVRMSDIRRLPPVTPKGVTVTDFAERCSECGKQKKGKWVKEFKLITDGYTTFKKLVVTCSECGAENSSIYKNFCPNCGIEMEVE